MGKKSRERMTGLTEESRVRRNKSLKERTEMARREIRKVITLQLDDFMSGFRG